MTFAGYIELFRPGIACPLEHCLLGYLTVNLTVNLQQFLRFFDLVDLVSFVSDVYFILVILSLIVNEFHSLELSVSVHFELVDSDKFFYHNKSFFHSYYKSYTFFCQPPFVYTLILAFYIAFE
jgi:hypothetical protein